MWVIYTLGLIWMWIKPRLGSLIGTFVGVGAVIMLFHLFATYDSQRPTTTSIANCTHAAELHDKEMRRHLDKIDEQGQMIGVYKFRYKGLYKIESNINPKLGG